MSASSAPPRSKNWGVVSFLYITIVIGRGIPGLQDRWNDSPEDVTKYGIDKVASLRGPGNWVAWLVAVLSCFLDRCFARKINPGDRPASSEILGVGLNLVGVYEYPLIAAGFILAETKHYASPDLEEKHIGRLAAYLLVVRTGATMGSVLAGTCLLDWRKGTANIETVVWSSGMAGVLLAVTTALELILGHTDWRNSFIAFGLIPLWGFTREAIKFLLTRDPDAIIDFNEVKGSRLIQLAFLFGSLPQRVLSGVSPLFCEVENVLF